jgi:predicted kinase
VARLIVLDGPPGVGKSTQARRYLADHPLALSAELDAARRSLGRWQDDPITATRLARELTLAAAGRHLANGNDVLLPQYLGNPAFHADAECIANEHGAAFFEFVLMDDRDTVIARFRRRNAESGEDAHREAGELIDRLGGDDTLARMYDRLLQVLNARPRARLVHCPEGAADDVYRTLREVIDA